MVCTSIASTSSPVDHQDTQFRPAAGDRWFVPPISQSHRSVFSEQRITEAKRHQRGLFGTNHTENYFPVASRGRYAQYIV